MKFESNCNAFGTRHAIVDSHCAGMSRNASPRRKKSLDDDDVEIDDELDIEDVEADQDTEVAIVEMTEEEEEEEAEVFFIVENMPEFPGGDLALRKHIAENVKYPEIAKENGLSGKVFVQFVINQKGEVENVKIARGVDPALDKEAIRVVQNLPKWKPGSQRGKPVRVSYTVPINFQLN